MFFLKTVVTVEQNKLEQTFYFKKKVNFHYLPSFEQKQGVGVNDDLWFLPAWIVTWFYSLREVLFVYLGVICFQIRFNAI